MSCDSQEDFTPNESCTLCGADGGEFMGYLGKLPWYRCRMCGDVFTTEGGHHEDGEMGNIPATQASDHGVSD